MKAEVNVGDNTRLRQWILLEFIEGSHECAQIFPIKHFTYFSSYDCTNLMCRHSYLVWSGNLDTLLILQHVNLQVHFANEGHKEISTHLLLKWRFAVFFSFPDEQLWWVSTIRLGVRSVEVWQHRWNRYSTTRPWGDPCNVREVQTQQKRHRWFEMHHLRWTPWHRHDRRDPIRCFQ